MSTATDQKQQKSSTLFDYIEAMRLSCAVFEL